MTITILKAVAVIIILAVMILILLSVNHFLRGNFGSNQTDIESMRKEVENEENVISDHSVFKELVKVRTKHRP